jgi:hypothetical protein
VAGPSRLNEERLASRFSFESACLGANDPENLVEYQMERVKYAHSKSVPCLKKETPGHVSHSPAVIFILLS